MIELVPFEPNERKFLLTGDLNLLSPKKFELQFSLQDPQKEVLDSLPAPPSGNLVRAHELWKSTCFECFFALPDQERYWELNLSAKRQWNLYQFESYRTPQPPQESDSFYLSEFETDGTNLRCRLESRQNLRALDFSLCAVLKTAELNYYYSTLHAGKMPDFHLQQSRSLRREHL